MNWKLLLGLGGACAVCCAVPLAGIFVALAGGASGAFAIYSGAVLPAAGIAAGAALAAYGVVVWHKRRRATLDGSASCGCAGTPQDVQSSFGKGSC